MMEVPGTSIIFVECGFVDGDSTTALCTEHEVGTLNTIALGISPGM